MHRLLILLLPLILAGCAFNDDAELRLLCYHGEVVGQVDGFPVSGDGSVRGVRVDADQATLSRVTASVDGETCRAEVRAP